MEARKATGNVLVCPLGWGLGHASRVIPIINFLSLKGWNVIVAADRSSIALIQGQFPNIQCVHFPSLRVRLKRGRFQGFALMGIAIKLFIRVFTEHRDLKRLIKSYRINLVISDNRYGLYSRDIPCVLITHLLGVPLPFPLRWLQSLSRLYVGRYAGRFAQCWVPDSPSGFSLSGELSSNEMMLRNLKRVGLLSRFRGVAVKEDAPDWELLAILSGPEPHRTLLEREVIAMAQREGIKTLLVRGMPECNLRGIADGFITLTPHLQTPDLANAIANAKYLICRSGYSTLMDLAALNRSALLIPTPGQTEQEYLAAHLSGKGIFSTISQDMLRTVTRNVLERIPKQLPKGLGFEFFGEGSEVNLPDTHKQS